MLVGFSVSNFKSFKDTQKISFVASKISRHKDHISLKKNKKILKTGLIFGANASGKSNLVDAVAFSREIIVNGLERVNLNKSYFRIENEMYKEPGIFEYRIILGDTEYSYGVVISYYEKIILSEWLIEVGPNGEERYIFNRETDSNNFSYAESDIKFQNKDDEMKMKFYLDGFSNQISETYMKKTILSDIALRTTDQSGVFYDIRKIFDWFWHIIILFPETKYNRINELASDENRKKTFSDFMNYFDTGIESLEGESQAMEFEKILGNLPPSEAEKMKIQISNAANEKPVMFRMYDQIFTLYKDVNGNLVYNKLLLNHGNSEDMFDYIDESDGTKRLFDLIPLFYEEQKASLILIDEIDRSLHTNLTRKFLELFYFLSADKSCQIIATTHDSNLLDLELLRQDEIWFVERQDNHSSSLFSLNKFRERFDKRIDKEYLLGRYGAIPVFNDSFILEEMNEE